jgi:hypothetical protein
MTTSRFTAITRPILLNMFQLFKRNETRKGNVWELVRSVRVFVCIGWLVGCLVGWLDGWERTSCFQWRKTFASDLGSAFRVVLWWFVKTLHVSLRLRLSPMDVIWEEKSPLLSFCSILTDAFVCMEQLIWKIIPIGMTCRNCASRYWRSRPNDSSRWLSLANYADRMNTVDEKSEPCLVRSRSSSWRDTWNRSSNRTCQYAAGKRPWVSSSQVHVRFLSCGEDNLYFLPTEPSVKMTCCAVLWGFCEQSLSLTIACDEHCCLWLDPLSPCVCFSV